VAVGNLTLDGLNEVKIGKVSFVTSNYAYGVISRRVQDDASLAAAQKQSIEKSFEKVRVLKDQGEVDTWAVARVEADKRKAVEATYDAVGDAIELLHCFTYVVHPSGTEPFIRVGRREERYRAEHIVLPADGVPEYAMGQSSVAPKIRIC